MFSGIPCTLYMFYENNACHLYTYAEHHAEAAGYAKGHAQMLQPARETNTGRIPRPGLIKEPGSAKLE